MATPTALPSPNNLSQKRRIWMLCDNGYKGVCVCVGGWLAKWHLRVTTTETVSIKWRCELDKRRYRQSLFSCTLTGARGVESIRLCTQVSWTARARRGPPGGGVAESWTIGALALCAPFELAHRTSWWGQGGRQEGNKLACVLVQEITTQERRNKRVPSTVH